MKTLEEAQVHVQRLHSIVERWASALKLQEDTQPFGGMLRRAATPVVGLLRGQFGSMSDQVATVMLIATRGGGEQMKVRGLREAVAQLRQQVDIAITRVAEHHTVEIDTGRVSED